MTDIRVIIDIIKYTQSSTHSVEISRFLISLCFYVKSILEILEVQKLQFLPFQVKFVRLVIATYIVSREIKHYCKNSINSKVASWIHTLIVTVYHLTIANLHAHVLSMPYNLSHILRGSGGARRSKVSHTLISSNFNSTTPKISCSLIETIYNTMVSLVYHFVSGEKKFYQRQRQNVVGARDKKKRQRLYHIGSLLSIPISML